MKKTVFLVGSTFLLVIAVVIANHYVKEVYAPLIRRVLFDYQKQQIVLLEKKGNKIEFENALSAGYSNTDLFSEDFSVNKRYAVTSILKENVLQLYVFDFDNKNRLIVDSSFYDLIKEDLEGSPLNYDYFWHPTENVLMVSLRGLYYPTRLFLFRVQNEELLLENEIKISNAEDLQPYGWIKSSNNTNLGGNGFLVKVITSKTNAQGSGAIIPIKSYFSVVGVDGTVEN